MTTWEAILLGIVQGLTEFLPISSSGHLELSQHLLGFEALDRYIFFNLLCHLGTLGSILCVFAVEIKSSLRTHRVRWLQVLCGTLPLFPLVLVLKPIKAVFDQPHSLGLCFLVTAALLFCSSKLRFNPSTSPHTRRWSDPLTIGLFQAVAILPGISRSGATISAARMLGWSKPESTHFSFMLAIPAILGGIVLELWQLLKASPASNVTIEPLPYLAAMLTSFVVGCVALKLLVRMVANDSWTYFAWYCLFLGSGTFIYFNLP